MRYLLPVALLLAAVPAIRLGAAPADGEMPASATGAPCAPIDFSWREIKGDFPATDRTTYLILTSEHAVAHSLVLPAFVRHKESIGYRVIVATEKDYGDGKGGQELAFHLRAWLRDFQRRTNAKYALLVGNTHPGHAGLPAQQRPDGERRGMDEGYRDLDSPAIDLYLKNPSPYKPEKERPGQELQIGRISYVPGAFGVASAYDLDRILEKTIRYERDTLSGKGLDWRANSITVQTNYGSSDWDRAITRLTRHTGGMNEHWAQRGWKPADIVPQNYSPTTGVEVTRNFYCSTVGHGFATNSSHGWSGGGEGIGGTNHFLAQDDRFPAVTAVTACTGLDPVFADNQGQARLRRGAIFVIGTAHSGNLNARDPFLGAIMNGRLATGAAMGVFNPRWYGTMAYGDPSLAILPQAAGTPATTLGIEPMAAQTHVERGVDIGQAPAPFTRAYTLTNHTDAPIEVALSSNAAWLSVSPARVVVRPGSPATVTAATTAALATLEAGRHEATVRFAYPGQQTAERYVALEVRPVTLEACHDFAEVGEKPNYRDITKVGLPPPRHPQAAAEIAALAKGDTPPAPAAEWSAEARVGGGCVRLKATDPAWAKALPALALWSGASCGFWFNLDALPAPAAPAGKKPVPPAESTLFRSSLFRLKVGVDGTLALVGKGEASLGEVKPGEWHHVLLRTDLAGQRVLCTLDGAAAEVAVPLDPGGELSQHVAVGPFAGRLDEFKLWSGELSEMHRQLEIAGRALPVAVVRCAPAAGTLCHPTTPLTWHPLDPAANTAYRVYLGTEVHAVHAAAAGSPLERRAGSKETTLAVELQPGRTYFWRVDAEAGGRIVRGEVQSFRTHALPYANLKDQPGTASVLPVCARMPALPGVPAAAVLDAADAKVDLAAKLPGLPGVPVKFTLYGAPEWAHLTPEGILSFAPGADPARVDFGGYNAVLRAEAGGASMEQFLRILVPRPDIRFKLVRARDNTLVFQPLGKLPIGAVIRYTTDGSPVDLHSPVYTGPVRVQEGMVPAGRLFWGAYAFDTVSQNTPFGISREAWKPLAVSGRWPRRDNRGRWIDDPAAGVAASAAAFDGTEAAFTHAGGVLPQFLAWDLGADSTLTSLACQCTIAKATGRIKDYALYASADGKAWTEVARGAFESLPSPQEIEFKQPVAARYLKLEAMSLHEGKDMVVTEIEAYGK